MREAARRLDVHENTIRNWIDTGLIAAHRLPSGTRRIAPGEIERLVRETYGADTDADGSERKTTPAPRNLGAPRESLVEHYQHLLPEKVDFEELSTLSEQQRRNQLEKAATDLLDDDHLTLSREERHEVVEQVVDLGLAACI